MLTVLGGSRSRCSGDLVPDAIAMIETPLRSKMRINQQARPEQINQLKARYKALKVSASIKPFFNNMPNLLAKSDLVISRSGASSIAELAATGTASLMLPLPSAMDDHQKANATQMEQVGGGYCLDEATVSPRLPTSFNCSKRLINCAQWLKMQRAASPAAANDIATLPELQNPKHNSGVLA